MTTEDKFRMLLSDLGKATLRGVKKCLKCGMYNGSRGTCCKNKNCNAVFKEPGEKRKLSTEACKLITGTVAQVFSVRMRDKGLERRGFVQLPYVNLAGSSQLLNQATQTSALCFVDNCEKSFNNSVLQCHEKELSDLSSSTCQHVEAALKCHAEAKPLTLRNSILLSLNVNSETKQEIWLLATETSGPLVQRVSKNIMAVKCKTSSKHPLGYLHFSFFTTKSKDKVEHKFFCNCSTCRVPNNVSEEKMENLKCIHFYACICAFASDPKLSEEFQYYISHDRHSLNFHESLEYQCTNDQTEKLVEMDLENLSDDTHLLILKDNTLNIQIDPSLFADNVVDIIKENENNLIDSGVASEMQNLDKIDQNTMLEGSTIKIIKDSSIVGSSNTLSNGSTVKILDQTLILDTTCNFTPITPTVLEITAARKTVSGKRKRKDKNLTTIINLNSIELRKSKTKTFHISKNYPDTCENVDESTTDLSFTKWLSSITESINQTMHFQFNGKPDPLVFHAPQTFFECLRERISCGGKKKRLPNTTTAFVRKDAVPLGTFTKYTWHITNILHVKSIFETPLVPLEITKSFLQNADGTYELYKREEEEIDRFRKTGNNALIKPLELKTYLKVGNTSPNQVQPTPFLIEWTPDILPVSKIGELRIQFEFGHVKSEYHQKWEKNYVKRKQLSVKKF